MSQLARFQLFNLIAFSFAYIPIIYPFFTVAREFSNREFFALFAAYYFTMCVLEVPTGLLADRLGRRNSLVLGCFVLALSSGVIFLAGSFPTAAIGMILSGAGHTLLSGADSAWLYDHLLSTDRAHECLRQEGAASGMRMIGVSVLFTAGGAGAEYIGFGFAFLLSAVTSLAAGIVALTLKEPARQKSRHKLLVHLGASVATTFLHPPVRWIFLYFTLLFLLLRVAFHLYQPFMLEVGIDNYLVYGLTLGLLNVVAAPFARNAERFESWVGERWLATSLPLLMSLSFVLLFLFPSRYSIAFFALQQIPYGLTNPVTRAYTNRHIGSEDRATVLSMQSFSGRLTVALFSLVAGESLDRAGSVGPLYLAIGCGALVLAFLLHAGRPR